jgi:hypothetical protein
MHSTPVGGAVGPFVDPATGQPVPARFFGSVGFEYNGNPEALVPLLKNRIQMAVSNVLAEKLASGQVALGTLQQSAPHFIAEIVAQSGVQAMGVRVTHMQLDGLELQAPVAAGLQPMAMPPAPMQAAASAFGQAAADSLAPGNREYEARIKVGGFNVNASTDGGLDTAGLKNQVVGKAKSAVIWYAAGCLVVLFVFLGIAGVAGYLWYTHNAPSTASAGPAKASAWDGKSAFTCGGNDNYKLDGVTANLPEGTAIKAQANCKLELVNCNITAPIAIETAGNATVEVKGGSIQGMQFAARALGSSKINFKGTRLSGKTQSHGGAKITNGG